MSEKLSFDRRTVLRLGGGLALAPVLGGCAGDDYEVTLNPKLPIGEFGASSTAEEVTAGLDLSGKVAMVTGCNSGLGYETMRVLASRGAHVIGSGRTLVKAETACRAVTGETTPVALELSDFQSVVDCAARVAELGKPIDILVCNAGINTFGELELINGIERIFTVNHLGHFVLVNRLLPLMRLAESTRIVNVGSRSGYTSAPVVGIDFDNLRGEKIFDAGEAYGRSKLANALFSNELSRRLTGGSVTSNVIHPGLVKTNIARTAPTLLRSAFEMFGGLIAKTPEEGAATQVYVATAPALEGVSGAYFEDCNPVRVSGAHHMDDPAMAARLWAVSEEMTSQFLL
ncbi:MAG: NAD(P)-dependent dehydrogenase (short-subunit alcohol dehydrogenase family) [Halieaceae bacterium]|jgi:NAD(P)-dependent dehydrogenase (short-subunit alcohol dehydrogenase family)